ncbi:MAG: hypothetical protein WKF47_05220 [Geodermatophilaceae bacterium]
MILQPLFLLFVFGKVLGDLGYTPGQLRAGAFARRASRFTAFLTALQNVAFPLVIDFSYTKEIEDRLLAPLPTCAGRRREDRVRHAAGAHRRRVDVPARLLGPGRGVDHLGSAVPAVAMFLVLGSLVGAALGLTLGTLVTASKINLVFAIVADPAAVHRQHPVSLGGAG